MGETLAIYYNDLTDSDNWVAAKFLQLAAAKDPSVRVMWIVEPRHVAFGLRMSMQQRKDCTELLAKHFVPRARAFKVLLAGLLTQEQIDAKAGELTPAERELLKYAIKPPRGPKQDAKLHGKLVTLDLATYISAWSGSPVEIFLDMESLKTRAYPMNLYLSHDEDHELRTLKEARAWKAIHGAPTEADRVSQIRSWYQECIRHLEKRIDDDIIARGSRVSDLDFESLCDSIRAAHRVKFFGGSSLAILQRLHEAGFAGKIECSLQSGTFDLEKNLFPNQFNIELNVDAARFVFANSRDFLRFSMAPSDTVQKVQYCLTDLCKGDRALEKRCLGYNLRVDMEDIASGKITLDNAKAIKNCTMPDLTAFLCCGLSPGFGGATLAHADLDEDRGKLTLKPAPATEGLPVYIINAKKDRNGADVPHVLGESEIKTLLESLSI